MHIFQLGNYLGALSNWVHLQQTATSRDKLIFSIVGWHALTQPQDPEQLASARMDVLAVLLAIGIDPERSIVFQQDQVRLIPYVFSLVKARWDIKNQCHTELAWILSCLTPFGKLRRMTTWKVSVSCLFLCLPLSPEASRGWLRQGPRTSLK